MGAPVLSYGLAFAVVGLLTLLELRRGAMLDSNRLLNITNWALRIGLAFAFMRFLPTLARHSLFDLRALPWLAQFLVFFLLLDLAEYLFHRAQHAVPALWALHSLHHSDPAVNATTAERHHWVDQFVKALTIYPAVLLIVAADGSVGFAYMLVGLWNYVAHSSLPINFGRFSWLFQSPAYHRRHHSSVAEHYNSNFAALLPIWDVLFGSYRKPDGYPPTGLAEKPDSVLDLLTWPARSVGRKTVAQ